MTNGRAEIAESTRTEAEGGFDIGFRSDGSITLFSLFSPQGRIWWQTNVDPECQRFGKFYAVETRYAIDIIIGAIDDGLNVEML